MTDFLMDFLPPDQLHSKKIEICGVCGRRVFRIGPDKDMFYCEKSGLRKHAVEPTRIYQFTGELHPNTSQ